MATGTSYITCPVCGFADAQSTYNCNTSEEWSMCERCGYHYERTRVSAHTDGEDGEGRKVEFEEKEIRDAHCVLVCTNADRLGHASCVCRTPADLERLVAKVKEAPAIYSAAFYTSCEDGVWWLKDVFSDRRFRFDSYADIRRAIAASERVAFARSADAAGGAAC